MESSFNGARRLSLHIRAVRPDAIITHLRPSTAINIMSTVVCVFIVRRLQISAHVLNPSMQRQQTPSPADDIYCHLLSG